MRGSALARPAAPAATHSRPPAGTALYGLAQRFRLEAWRCFEAVARTPRDGGTRLGFPTGADEGLHRRGEWLLYAAGAIYTALRTAGWAARGLVVRCHHPDDWRRPTPERRIVWWDALDALARLDAAGIHCPTALPDSRIWVDWTSLRPARPCVVAPGEPAGAPGGEAR